MENKKYSTVIKTLYLVVVASLNMGTFFGIKIGEKQLSISYSEVFLFISLIIIMFKYNNLFKIPLEKYLYLKLLVISWVIIVSFWSVQVGQNLGIAKSLIVGVLSFILFYNIFNYDYYLPQKGLRVFGLILSVIMLVNIIVNIVNGPPISTYAYYAIKEFAKTPLGRSNNLSIYLEFLLLYEIVLKGRNWYKYCMLYLISIFATLSRTGIILTFGGLFLTFLISRNTKGEKDNSHKNKSDKNKKIYYLLFAIALIVAITYMSKNINQFTNFSSGNTRLNIWKQHIEVFAESPIVGRGYQLTEEFPDAHNIIVTILSSFGLVGLLLFTVLLIHVIAKVFKNIKHYNSIGAYKESRLNVAFLASFTIIFVHSFFEPYLLSSTTQIFISIFIATIYTEPSSLKVKINV
ncbi:O-antigen ligase family protein [Clostridium algidicarnis]|uniref:O-antigen ligase n=1 Tax=Clostridium algidicarnis DSM 15099 TaxID=1121295 RepID=A0A2S6FUY0_9CLOT|nr:O-antigen ligase family protein [Clostridium algidicarnis]PPK45281.1 O-antigen ligase [Clostridium algidicarnis DSM 15099]